MSQGAKKGSDGKDDGESKTNLDGMSRKYSKDGNEKHSQRFSPLAAFLYSFLIMPSLSTYLYASFTLNRVFFSLI